MKASLELLTMRKVAWRLVPFLCVLCVIAFIMGSDVELISIIMGDDLGINSKMLGWGTGMFFISCLFLAMPGKPMQHQFGARRGGAEAGLFPVTIVAITRWSARRWRGRVTAAFVAPIPISSQRRANRPRHQPA